MERIKQFFAAPTHWQRLALLSILSMFISHLILLSSQASNTKGEVDIFALVAGAVILLFVVGWSALNGSSDTKFVSRTFGVVCASFEIHRLSYSFIWPEKLNEIEQPTFTFFSIVLIFGLFAQSLTGKSISDYLILMNEKIGKINKIKVLNILPKNNIAYSKTRENTEKEKP